MPQDQYSSQDTYLHLDGDPSGSTSPIHSQTYLFTAKTRMWWDLPPFPSEEMCMWRVKQSCLVGQSSFAPHCGCGACLGLPVVRSQGLLLPKTLVLCELVWPGFRDEDPGKSAWIEKSQLGSPPAPSSPWNKSGLAISIPKSGDPEGQ